MHHAVLVLQRIGAGLDPNTFRKRGITQKHLCAARLSAKGASQGILLRRERCYRVAQKESVVLSPFLTGHVGRTQAHNLFRRCVPDNELSLLVRGDQSLAHAVQH